MNDLFLAAFGVFMDTMQGHQLPQGSDLDHAIDLVRVLSRYYDDEVSGAAFLLPFDILGLGPHLDNIEPTSGRLGAGFGRRSRPYFVSSQFRQDLHWQGL